MKKLCIHKKSRPADWDTWKDEDKIEWLDNRKNPTANELKELRYLTQKKKFAGFNDWAKKQTKEEKNIEKIKERQRAKCRRIREINSCVECLRYRVCYENEKEYGEELTYSELRLGQAIIVEIENSIRRCYKNGWRDQLNYWLKVLESERTGILTAETVDGHASAQMLMARCEKEYGKFDVIYKKCQDTYLPKINALEEEYSTLKKSSVKAKKISMKIIELLKKLYGDTI